MSPHKLKSWVVIISGATDSFRQRMKLATQVSYDNMVPRMSYNINWWNCKLKFNRDITFYNMVQCSSPIMHKPITIYVTGPVREA